MRSKIQGYYRVYLLGSVSRVLVRILLLVFSSVVCSIHLFQSSLIIASVSYISLLSYRTIVVFPFPPRCFHLHFSPVLDTSLLWEIFWDVVRYLPSSCPHLTSSTPLGLPLPNTPLDNPYISDPWRLRCHSKEDPCRNWSLWLFAMAEAVDRSLIIVIPMVVLSARWIFRYRTIPLKLHSLPCQATPPRGSFKSDYQSSPVIVGSGARRNVPFSRPVIYASLATCCSTAPPHTPTMLFAYPHSTKSHSFPVCSLFSTVGLVVHILDDNAFLW